MRSLIGVIFIAVSAFYACTDTDDQRRTFQYVIKNKFDSKVILLLYDDDTKRNELQSFVFNSGDSVSVYECSKVTGEGFCDPFDGSNVEQVEADYGMLIFEDEKVLEFKRFEDQIYNLLSGSRYDEPYKISDQSFIETYSIDSSDYLLAK